MQKQKQMLSFCFLEVTPSFKLRGSRCREIMQCLQRRSSRCPVDEFVGPSPTHSDFTSSSSPSSVFDYLTLVEDNYNKYQETSPNTPTGIHANPRREVDENVSPCPFTSTGAMKLTVGGSTTYLLACPSLFHQALVPCHGAGREKHARKQTSSLRSQEGFLGVGFVRVPVDFVQIMPASSLHHAHTTKEPLSAFGSNKEQLWEFYDLTM